MLGIQGFSQCSVRVRIAPQEWWKSPVALMFGGQVTGSCDHFKDLLGRGDEQDHI
jgi:hypothetical protein